MGLKRGTLTIFLFTLFFIISAFKSSFAANVTLNSKATIAAAALTATESKAMDFGSIISNKASELTINASSAAAKPAVTSGNASVSGGESGLITITTNLDASLTVTYPVSATISDGGGNSMTISQIAANSTASPIAATVSGTNEVNVGGILTVTSGQAPGNYAGTFTVTVNF